MTASSIRETAPLPRTIRAATVEGYSAPVKTTEIPSPSINADEVLIEVAAAGVDRGVWHLMTGEPYLIRILGYGFRRPKQPVLGLDVAGNVVATGDDVTRFSVGDRVFGIADGSFAEYAKAKEEKLVTTPAGLSDESAAVAAVSGITAREAVVDHGRVSNGDRVLVIGASGGVGSFAVQIARSLGAEVTAVGGPGSAAMLRDIGAAHTLDYTTDDVADSRERFDVIVDIAGRRPLRELRSVLTPTGTLVIVGGEGGNRLTGGIGRQLWATIRSLFSSQRLCFFISKEHHDNIERLAAFLERGEIAPVIDRRFDLDDVGAALDHLVNGRAKGKSVIIVKPDEAGRRHQASPQ